MAASYSLMETASYLNKHRSKCPEKNDQPILQYGGTMALKVRDSSLPQGELRVYFRLTPSHEGHVHTRLPSRHHRRCHCTHSVSKVGPSDRYTMPTTMAAQATFLTPD